jgi:hypothetical protein
MDVTLIDRETEQDTNACTTTSRAAPITPEFTPALAREMAPLYERVKDVVTPLEWPAFAPLIKQINDAEG